MTPAVIALIVIVVILILIIVRMVRVWPRPKKEPKTFGLSEAENFLAKVPGVTREEIKKLILPWTIVVLGYSNTVGKDADAEITTISLANDEKRDEIQEAQATIKQLEHEIAAGQEVIGKNDSRIDRVIEVTKVFES